MENKLWTQSWHCSDYSVNSSARYKRLPSSCEKSDQISTIYVDSPEESQISFCIGKTSSIVPRKMTDACKIWETNKAWM